MTHLETLAAEELVVCDAVLTETALHLPYASQRQRLRALIAELKIEAAPITDERGFWLEVFDWLGKHADHEPDWADGCLAVLSGRDRSLELWTYDRDFKTIWRRPNGTLIPLAVSPR